MSGLFDEIADGEKSICYIVTLPIEQMTKLGYTNVDVKIRVSRFRFAHDLTGLEKDVVIVGEYQTPMAKTIEHYAKKIADRHYDKVMDKNLGSGLINVGAALNLAKEYINQEINIVISPEANLKPTVRFLLSSL